VWVGTGASRCVHLLLYADDIVLLADSPEALQRMLDAASEYAKQWRFRFNCKAGKSDVVISPPLAEPPRFTLGGQQLHIADEYKYLGVEMGQIDKDTWQRYLARINGGARVASRQLLYSASGRRPLRISTTVHLFKTLVRPIMEYADGIWGAMCSEAAMTLLDHIQIDFGKRLLRLPKQVANEYVLLELGLESMRERADLAALKFFVHLAKLKEHRLAGWLFRRRCRAVDSGTAQLSWCNSMRDRLMKMGELNDGKKRQPLLTARCLKDEVSPEGIVAPYHAKIRADKVAGLHSLSVVAEMQPVKLDGWLDKAFTPATPLW
jgi:hypothetical protein